MILYAHLRCILSLGTILHAYVRCILSLGMILYAYLRCILSLGMILHAYDAVSFHWGLFCMRMYAVSFHWGWFCMRIYKIFILPLAVCLLPNIACCPLCIAYCVFTIAPVLVQPRIPRTPKGRPNGAEDQKKVPLGGEGTPKKRCKTRRLKMPRFSAFVGPPFDTKGEPEIHQGPQLGVQGPEKGAT